MSYNQSAHLNECSPARSRLESLAEELDGKLIAHVGGGEVLIYLKRGKRKVFLAGGRSYDAVLREAWDFVAGAKAAVIAETVTDAILATS